MNYSNISDVDFEYLCKDVMSKMLGKNLFRFAPGKDGGVDLTDDTLRKNVVVQVKHFNGTSFSGLLGALKKELPKVQTLKPKQYYVCCSKSLTRENINSVYELFSEYMQSPQNVISAIELDEFLQAEENAEILRKHFKLWLDSTNTLTNVFTGDVLIDSEVLLAGIEEQKNLFVRTRAFDKALECLEKFNALMLVGNPGVGKSITSKMLVLNFVAQGYRVRYTTDGADLSALKRSLSQAPSVKEIVLLDDCFGQAYYKMKETQENELLALIKYVNLSQNKLLIMNSRIAIYQEAKEKTPALDKSLSSKEYKAFVLNMESINLEDKARIFYNHLYFEKIPREYFEKIKENRTYCDIVRHKNYNPRIIEYVTGKTQLEKVKPDEYVKFINSCLDNPEQMWRNEYEYRLADVDRIFITTVHSLTDYDVDYNLLKQCFEHRLSLTNGIDCSINHFEKALNRLYGSMVKLIDYKGKKTLAVANPSVSDFLRGLVANNAPLKQVLIATAHSVMQYKRLLSEEEFTKLIREKFSDKSILSLSYESQKQKQDFILCWCALNEIKDEAYSEYVIEYVKNVHMVNLKETGYHAIYFLTRGVFSEEMRAFYGLDDMLKDLPNLLKIFEPLQLEDAVDLLNSISGIFKGEEREQFCEVMQNLIREKAEEYCDNVPVDFYEGSISDIIEQCKSLENGAEVIDANEAAEILSERVKESAMEKLNDVLDYLPYDVLDIDYLTAGIEVTVEDTVSAIRNYVDERYFDEYDPDLYGDRVLEDDILDEIFDR